MKKKLHQSGAALSGQQSADYVVGQVSGSLFQKDSTSSGSLSALFSTAAPAAPLLFQPAPKPVQKSTETKEQQKEAPGVKVQPSKKKPPKEKSAADQKLENRESSLQNADEDESGQKTSAKKRKSSEPIRENDVEHWVLKRQRLKVNRQEEAVKRKRTVFVGNLPISCTKKTLRSLFRDKGSIESIRFRSVVREDPSMSQKLATIKRKFHPKKQSMNAYVVFTDEEGVTMALERNGTEIERDFHIRVDRVTDSSSHDHKRSVFVGNLSFEITELVFRRHFEECGSVEAVRLVRDQKSGLGKGFGYVLFESADSVQLALKLDGSKLEGRSIRVKRSVKKEKLKTKTESKGASGRAGRGPKRGPAKGPTRGSGRNTGGGGLGGFKSQKKFSGNQLRSTKSSTSFKGEMTDPNKKPKKKGLKKKQKPNKTVHI
ncbi:RNA-binding protein 34 RNA-binding motif protein 34 [Channa argus]|uniref:RNA-binding protein 34 RNA-binding motif protein 34 n=1 Tax=Channa argus TaxID=215402 RepID=A0A6G1PCX8_CHAAH|nr:RNA-binding protein 34 RNA-binding motif protein 34 [Channa argus]